MSTKLTDTQNATMGLLCGGIEVSLLQGTNYLKNASQQGLPMTMNPRTLYRGYPSNLLNMGSCTMWQFAVCGIVAKQLTGGKERRLAPWEDMTAGLVAGVTSGVLGGPLELMMIQQQLKGGSVTARFAQIGPVTYIGGQIGPGIFRGLVPTGAREGMWAVGYLSFPPIIRNYLLDNHSDTFTNENAARTVAAIFGAFVSCVASHPFDTVKTNMQGDIERKKFGGMMDTFKKLHAEGGLQSFYRGLPWRYGRQFCGVFLLDKLRTDLTPVVFPHAA